MTKPTPYTPKAHYNEAELDAFALADLRADAEQAERQARDGPFYPERGVTAESLRDYAAKCRRACERYAQGGAHVATLKGVQKTG